MPKQGITTALVDFRDNQRFVIMTLLAAVVYLLFCAPAQASPIASVLCSVINVIIIDVGRALGTLAIIVLGISALLGKATWGQGLTVIVGVGIVTAGPGLGLWLYTAAMAGTMAAAVVGQGGILTTAAALALCSPGVPGA